MDLKEHLRNELVNSRGFSEKLLADFHTPEEWLFQVHPQANHALWFAGHMGQTDNFFISMLDPAQVFDRPGHGEKFGMGSQPTNNPAEYPPVEEVLAYMRQRRQTLLNLLDGLSEADLAQPTPAGTPAFLPDVASIFRTAAWHEAMHAGQVSVARRALGNKPVMGG